MLRRILVWDKEIDREIVLLTNHLDFSATTVSAIHKDRRQIELFFKVLKQNLKVKTFVGTTENALFATCGEGETAQEYRSCPSRSKIYCPCMVLDWI